MGQLAGDTRSPKFCTQFLKTDILNLYFPRTDHNNQYFTLLEKIEVKDKDIFIQILIGNI